MSFEEVTAYAKQKQAELGVADKSKSGILVGAIMKDLGVRAHGAVVKEAVESLLD